MGLTQVAHFATLPMLSPLKRSEAWSGCPRQLPNNESATARATTQDNMDPQRIRKACSARRRRIGGSCRARAVES